MTVEKTQIEHIAKLAKLKFSEKEVGKFTDQFNDIIKYMDVLQAVDTSDVPPATHPLPNYNVFREDVADQVLSIEETLNNAPDSEERFFKVPKIIQE